MALAALVVGICTGERAANVLAQDAALPVTQQLVEYRFLPADLRFKAGALYRLQLENSGRETHEFTAPDFLKSVDLKNPEILVQAGNEVLLQPGERKELLFTPQGPGRFKLICADHDWAGMVGEIVVE